MGGHFHRWQATPPFFSSFPSIAVITGVGVSVAANKMASEISTDSEVTISRVYFETLMRR